MAKVNPLFQDSSLSNGTNIRTQFELKKVIVKEDEKVFLFLVDGSEKKYIEMKCIDVKTGTYTCSAWLKHKTEIGYQFFIKANDKIIAVSEYKLGIAMYTLLETWAPSQSTKELEEVSKQIKMSPESAFVEDVGGSNTTGEDIIENLIEKWGL